MIIYYILITSFFTLDDMDPEVKGPFKMIESMEEAMFFICHFPSTFYNSFEVQELLYFNFNFSICSFNQYKMDRPRAPHIVFTQKHLISIDICSSSFVYILGLELDVVKVKTTNK